MCWRLRSLCHCRIKTYLRCRSRWWGCRIIRYRIINLNCLINWSWLPNRYLRCSKRMCWRLRSLCYRRIKTYLRCRSRWWGCRIIRYRIINLNCLINWSWLPNRYLRCSKWMCWRLRSFRYRCLKTHLWYRSWWWSCRFIRYRIISLYCLINW
jgi:hypothetical protein